ncbi:MAG: glutamate--tRNA ligase [Anaerolineales bacterium]|nr:glutamate--tRNA ligase [Anaerolineales bacterium]
MKNGNNTVRVRFAPSPTGRVHLGAARTALYNYLVARQMGGQFILRIEDTDTKRYVEGAEDELINGLRWLGIEWDEGPDVGGPYAPYRQTERQEIYREYIRKLLETGYAYPCFCSLQRLEQVRQQQQRDKTQQRYDGLCRGLLPDEISRRIAAGEEHVIRFKTPYEGSTTAHDLIRGDITVENKNLDDYILFKSNGLPTYHFAAMVDDHLMGITHVIRGSEWLSTFPLHALIIRAFGWEEPQWVHLSVFLKPSGKGKMSKRDADEAVKDGKSIYIKDLKELGYIPAGILNWMVLMGWGVAEDDVMNLNEMSERFRLNGLNPAPAAINFGKLDHFNGTHIRLMPTDELAELLQPVFAQAGYDVDDTVLLKVIPLIRERLITLDDCLAFAGWFFQEDIEPKPEDLVAKNLSPSESAEIARQIYDILADLPVITHESAEAPLRDLVEKLGLKPNQVFGILRVAVTGQQVSPPLFESMEIVGKETVLKRVGQAIDLLESMG